MKVTGERFIPGQMYRDAEIEHFHRYTAVQNLVNGKIVLDAACGSGYGSKLLSDSAAKVYGLDLSYEAIEYAKDRYQNEKIEYLQGSVEALPFENASVDIVISFETIEHVDGQTQRKFLQEIHRVLKEDGILIMSSPNKKLFTDDRQLITTFHVKEFYEKEFLLVLKEYCPFYRLYNQYFSKVSNIVGETEQALIPLNYDYQRKGLFLIAIASKKALTFKDSIDSCYYYPEEYSRYNDKLQIYFSSNGVYNESDCFIHEISNFPGVINETIDLENISGRYFRIDPNNVSCSLVIQNIIFILSDGTYLEGVKFNTNADKCDGSEYIFYSKDPQILFDLGKAYSIRAVTLQIKVLSSNIDLYPEYMHIINENTILRENLHHIEGLSQEGEYLKQEREQLKQEREQLKQEREQLKRNVTQLENLTNSQELSNKKIVAENQSLQLENDQLHDELTDITKSFDLVKSKWWYKLFNKN